MTTELISHVCIWGFMITCFLLLLHLTKIGQRKKQNELDCDKSHRYLVQSIEDCDDSPTLAKIRDSASDFYLEYYKKVDDTKLKVKYADLVQRLNAKSDSFRPATYKR